MKYFVARSARFCGVLICALAGIVSSSICDTSLTHRGCWRRAGSAEGTYNGHSSVQREPDRALPHRATVLGVAGHGLGAQIDRHRLRARHSGGVPVGAGAAHTDAWFHEPNQRSCEHEHAMSAVVLWSRVCKRGIKHPRSVAVVSLGH